MRDTLAKLKSLGYIGDGGPASAGTAGATRTPGSYNNEGVILKEHGKPVPAIEAFEHALALDPDLASALWNLSDCCTRGAAISIDPTRCWCAPWATACPTDRSC